MTTHRQSETALKGFFWVFSILLGAILCALVYLAISDYKNSKPRKMTDKSGSHEMLNAVIWQKTSAEFEAVARQIYKLAETNLKQALTDPKWSAVSGIEISESNPPAVILDLDETVIDNSGYEEYLIANKVEYSAHSFLKWCKSEKSDAVPGAVEFIQAAQSANVQVFFMSARKESQRACTTASLNRLGVKTTGKKTEMILTGGKDKQRHRETIARSHRVLLLIGDNLGDFTQGSRQSADQRRKTAKKHLEYWGRSWIILPNPMYGHWEAAFFAHDYSTPQEQKIEKKLNNIKSPK